MKESERNYTSERDYTEDYETNPDHQYLCRCGDCKEMFFGNKGRIVCKLCRKEPTKPIGWASESSMLDGM